MATPAQLAANTSNAQQSTGPRTEEGKSRVAQNATKWGFNAQSACLSTENKEEYEAFIQSYLNEKKPQSIEELFHVKTMADAMWRQNRVRRLENEILEQSLGTNPFTDSDERLSRELMKLTRYEKAIEGTFHKAAAEFKRLRKLDDDRAITMIRGIADGSDQENTKSAIKSFLQGTSYGTKPIPPIPNPVSRMTDAEKALRL
jgi:hypothetical protein